MIWFYLIVLITGIGWVATNWVKKGSGKAIYKSHCWNCKNSISSNYNYKCKKCEKYFICKICKKCLCDLQHIKRGKNYTNKKWVPYRRSKKKVNKSSKSKKYKTNKAQRICIKCRENYTTNNNPLCYGCWKKSDFKRKTKKPPH
tara:strand:- start:213 stop:644 length:432 start_codon:yes stop_codon:yes gene_type:complete